MLLVLLVGVVGFQCGNFVVYRLCYQFYSDNRDLMGTAIFWNVIPVVVI